MPAVFAVSRAAMVAGALFATLAFLRLLHREIPEYHAFWSGVVFWAAGAAVLFIPPFMTWLLLGRHGLPAKAFSALAAVLSLATLTVFDSRTGWVIAFAVGMILIFFASTWTHSSPSTRHRR
ncbi:hypothetical protein [Leekyejoonella antrihumi]|uniref:Uncharacterized protein n=1 Tax=Leekyejoonella antrihumi TaxID=1660198 RepID=A0A563DR01_9MICO|nr:hypothetical protein [Leekyejoonella antrihumi]TWP32718.1 hypothetical protein FGL98_23500 [Leekyejoonella antrihumi]